MIINYRYKFVLHKRKSSDCRNLPIRLRVTIKSRTPIDITTGLHCDLWLWDTEKYRVLADDAESNRINRILSEWSQTVVEIMNRYELIEKKIPTTEEFIELFNDYVGRPTKVKTILDNGRLGVFESLDAFVREQGVRNSWSDATYEKFRALRKHLLEFDKKLSWQTLTESKLQRYCDSLIKGGMRTSTLSRHIAFVRWWLRWCSKNNIYNGNLHETFKPKWKGSECKEVIYLSRQELDAVMNHEFSDNEKGLERIRDVFVFCCFTGLRYSDVAKLRRTDVKADEIVVTTKKTNDLLHIELNTHSRSILEKYKNNRYKDNLALPVISNVKMNAGLKRLGIVCGIDTPTRIVYFSGSRRIENVVPKYELLTTHVARRTFVVTALSLGVAADVIMRWTGHSDYKAMKPYIAIVDELKRNSMKKFDEI